MMKLDNHKLASIFETCGMNSEDAMKTATELYENVDKVMFRAILWAYAKFGNKATHDVEKIKEAMDNGRLNEFQAEAKLIHTEN